MGRALSLERIIVSMSITNDFSTKRTKVLLCFFVGVGTLIRVAPDAFTAISLGLVMVAVMILMATTSDVAQLIAGSIIVGSGGFIVGFNLGQLILS